MLTVRVVDSHTAGEPTRVVIDGGPDLGLGPLRERRERFRRDHDRFRSAIVNEPRGSDPIVGALLCRPVDPSCAAGVIFFNNVGYLNMCGHGTIGLIVTLAHLGRIGAGDHRIETPAGVVTARLQGSGEVSVDNVPSYRHRRSVRVDVPGHGSMTGDVAWGGNWFFLVSDHGQVISYENRERLTDCAREIRGALERNRITGAGDEEIDHIELLGPPTRDDADGKNFVLCPGGAYDRSPCGTGTSAKVACLAEDGKLEEGAIWTQESLIGSVFRATYRRAGETILPTITGSAYVNARSELILDASDPFCWGIR